MQFIRRIFLLHIYFSVDMLQAQFYKNGKTSLRIPRMTAPLIVLSEGKQTRDDRIVSYRLHSQKSQKLIQYLNRVLCTIDINFKVKY